MSAGNEPQELRLVDFPLAVYQRAAEHHAALQRELDVIRVSHPDVGSIPHRLAALLEEMHTDYVGFGPAMDMLGELAGSGQDRADVVIPIVAGALGASEAISRLRELMEEADEFCRAGDHLLTVATPPDLAAFRRWLFGEIIGQLGGAAPTAWSEFDRDRAAPSDPVVEQHDTAHPGLPLPEGWSIVTVPGGVRLVVTGPLDLGTAGTLREGLQQLRADGVRDVTVDLGAIGFVDSVGLSVLVSAHVRFTEDGGALHLLVPSRLQRLFEIAGLSDVLDLVTAPE
jgi:anti-anti-sigma factor